MFGFDRVCVMILLMRLAISLIFTKVKKIQKQLVLNLMLSVMMMQKPYPFSRTGTSVFEF
jgi:hypothetical protein